MRVRDVWANHKKYKAYAKLTHCLPSANNFSPPKTWDKLLQNRIYEAFDSFVSALKCYCCFHYIVFLTYSAYSNKSSKKRMLIYLSIAYYKYSRRACLLYGEKSIELSRIKMKQGTFKVRFCTFSTDHLMVFLSFS